MTDIVGKIIDFENGEMDEDQIIEFFQELINTGTITGLQGSYHRMACRLIEDGYCTIE